MAFTNIKNGDIPDANVLMANFNYLLSLIGASQIIMKDTAFNISQAATGTVCFFGWDINNKMLYFYPGDTSIGLITIGGAAAGPISDVSTQERG